MPYATDLAVQERGLSALGQQLLPVLYQHRLMSTGQLHALLQPHTARPVYLRRQLGRLRAMGLTDSTLRRRSGQGELLSYVTALGREVVEASGEVTPRAYRISEQAAASQLQEHTLAVNDTGVAFTAWARELGHECGPLAWESEIAHRMRDGEDRLSDRAFLIPDAVLRYTHVEQRQRRMLTFFLEIDRGTESPAALAGKLSAYARYHSYIPAPPAGRGRGRVGSYGSREAWRDRYPAAFPRLLIVLTGRARHVLQHRLGDLRALVAADGRLRRAAGSVRVGVVLLEDLQQQGPFAPVVTPLLDDGATATDVLLEPSTAGAAS